MLWNLKHARSLPCLLYPPPSAQASEKPALGTVFHALAEVTLSCALPVKCRSLKAASTLRSGTLLAALVSGHLGCGLGEPTPSQSSLPPALMPCGVGPRRAVGMGVGLEAPTLPALGLRTREGWWVQDMAECSPAPAFFLGT